MALRMCTRPCTPSSQATLQHPAQRQQPLRERLKTHNIKNKVVCLMMIRKVLMSQCCQSMQKDLPASTYCTSRGQGRYFGSPVPPCSTLMIERHVSSPVNRRITLTFPRSLHGFPNSVRGPSFRLRRGVDSHMKAGEGCSLQRHDA